MKLYCKFLDKGLFELSFDNNNPTVGDLKVALAKMCFDCTSQTNPNAVHKSFLPTFFWVVFKAQNLLSYKEDSTLWSLGIQDEDCLKIMIRPNFHFFQTIPPSGDVSKVLFQELTLQAKL